MTTIIPSTLQALCSECGRPSGVVSVQSAIIVVDGAEYQVTLSCGHHRMVKVTRKLKT